jgi:uncharacterized membrane protein
LSLALLHIGAEWRSLRDRTFLGRIWLAALTLLLAVAGGAIAPLGFVGLIVAAVLGQLILEAFTARAGTATILELPDAKPARRHNPSGAQCSWTQPTEA